MTKALSYCQGMDMCASLVAKGLPMAARHINELEAAMLAHPDAMSMDDMLTNHYISDTGLYVRELLIPAGCVVIGKAKSTGYVTIVSQGTIDVVSPSGSARWSAPFTTLSKANEKRILIALTDTVIVTAHRVSSTELKDIQFEVTGEIE